LENLLEDAGVAGRLRNIHLLPTKTELHGGEAPLMPVEVLTREEIEKIVEEKLKKLLSEMGISKKMAELESSTTKLKNDIARLSVKEAALPQPESVAAALTRDLAQLEDLLQIGITSSSVT
jgi:hypothetical protein